MPAAQLRSFKEFALKDGFQHATGVRTDRTLMLGIDATWVSSTVEVITIVF
jgi:hypothetical protein